MVGYSSCTNRPNPGKHVRAPPRRQIHSTPRPTTATPKPQGQQNPPRPDAAAGPQGPPKPRGSSVEEPATNGPRRPEPNPRRRHHPRAPRAQRRHDRGHEPPGEGRDRRHDENRPWHRGASSPFPTQPAPGQPPAAAPGTNHRIFCPALFGSVSELAEGPEHKSSDFFSATILWF